LAAAEKLAEEGLEIEVVDPRTLYPLDKKTIYNSIRKTNKAVVVTEENKRGGYAGEISAMISEEIFDELDAPVVRIGSLNTPIPFSPKLEHYIIPDSKDIINGIRKLV
jgi:pyruvate dehydrogenase E1 component beta subunit